MKLVLPAGVPTWLWIAGSAVLLLLAVVAFVLVRKATRLRKEVRQLRAERAAAVPGSAEEQAKAAEELVKAQRARRLVNIAATVCILLYLALFASSFQAIAGFAEHFLKRSGLMVPATPLTLDGVVIGALLLSLAFVAKQKSPAKAHALIWGMTIFSAYCGFQYGEGGKSGSDGSTAAGLYFAVMSLVGMFMFHMVLDLFMPDGDFVKSKYPGMGLRWITHWSTLPVMLAWVNHPPRLRDEEKRPSVREAIDHWHHVKTVRVRARSVSAAAAHTRKLDQARREGELAAARRDAERAAAAPAEVEQQPLTLAPVEQVGRPVRPHVVAFDNSAGRSTITADVPAAPLTAEQASPSVKVPSTPDACATWMQQWVQLSTGAPEFAANTAGIKQEAAQNIAGCSDRQARFVREAARSGQLRGKAEELNMAVPEGYRDRPEEVDRIRLASVAS